MMPQQICIQQLLSMTHSHRHSPLIHDCKVDCANPTEVMRVLMTKSDQLYLFWQNYNNLYEAYRALLIEVETLRSSSTSYSDGKDLGVTGFEQYIKVLEQNHERQRKRLKDEKEQYSQLFVMKDKDIAKLMSEVKQLKSRIDSNHGQDLSRDQRMRDDELKRKVVDIVKRLESRFSENLKKQLNTSRWEIRQQMLKIISHTAQACVTEVVEVVEEVEEVTEVTETVYR